MGHATHVSDLDLLKMIQLSTDRPNINWKFARTLSKDGTENGLPDLIDVGSCPLHVISRAFQTGSMASSWNLKEILKAEWQIIHDTPARREDFMSVTSSRVFTLPFCATRWVENKKAANRAILI